MLIKQNRKTYHIFWSENEQGWMYDFYDGDYDVETLPEDSDDGGCCTGSLEDALEMAGVDIYQTTTC